jgi:hypothetical protein
MPRAKPIAGWKVALFTSFALAVLFAAFGGISTGYTWRSMGFLALAGAVLGAIAAPDLEPTAFKNTTVWQMFFAILGCLLLAFHLKAEPVGYFIAVLVGATLGFYARHWTKYINLP